MHRVRRTLRSGWSQAVSSARLPLLRAPSDVLLTMLEDRSGLRVTWSAAPDAVAVGCAVASFDVELSDDGGATWPERLRRPLRRPAEPGSLRPEPTSSAETAPSVSPAPPLELACSPLDGCRAYVARVRAVASLPFAFAQSQPAAPAAAGGSSDGREDEATLVDPAPLIDPNGGASLIDPNGGG